MGKSYFLLFYLCICSTCLLAQEPACKDFKTGTFVLSNQEMGRDYRIIRNDSIQTEMVLNTGQSSKFRVKWLDDCTYELRIIEGPSEVMEFYKDKILKVTILATKGNEYTFEAQSPGLDYKSTQTIRKIK